MADKKIKRRKNRKAYPVHIGYGIFFIHLLFQSARFALSMYRLDYSLMALRPAYVLFWCIAPLGLYLWSTRYPQYNYRNIKSFCLAAVLLSEYITVLSLAFFLLSRIFLPWILSLHVDEAFTKDMVLILGRLAVQLPLVPLGLLIAKAIFLPLRDEKIKEEVLAYKITHSTPPEQKTRSGIAYNMNIVKDAGSGKPVTVYAKDRFLHTLVDGTSGTGKTSSTILPAIRDDLDMRCRAEDMQKQLLSEMEGDGKISYAPPDNAKGFSINDCIPIVKDTARKSGEEMELRLSEIRQELEQIRIGMPVCGITVLAPDDSLTDAVCRLCDARGTTYNRIDAVRQPDGMHKKNTVGMNPFYIPSQMDESARNQLIVKKAVIFSDVMQAITDLKGKADSYFTGLN